MNLGKDQTYLGFPSGSTESLLDGRLEAGVNGGLRVGGLGRRRLQSLVGLVAEPLLDDGLDAVGGRVDVHLVLGVSNNVRISLLEVKQR